ncbi:hypothetical protein [Lacisediminimonas sp.]|uniref:hypothetical protein n=1 Tax=Lacisediminimonas sp. TaxID=3060582 RepID=UPI00271EBEC4|nr:hypothetical protein [Lacisediminimonas sp.]MDO8300448.1 hypothetical protein [Lacisediminimonas sp.]
MSAGRSCPLSYRYAPEVFAAAASASTDTLYVVGGLYGNEQALESVLDMFAAEPGRKHLVFNGDFNWFNVAPASFARINERVLAFDALRGNVETELGPLPGGEQAGCGCGYPDWVDDAVVERSNAIIRQLAATAAGFPHWQQRLAALPMWRRIDVGGVAVAVVHGDAESLAGWGFARECLAAPSHAPQVQAWFDRAGVRMFASSHTCLPVLHGTVDGQGRPCLVANNGAAGMPNSAGESCGLLTRIATTRYQGGRSVDSARLEHLFIDTVPIDYDNAAWQAAFLAQWPPASAAHASYWRRIAEGPSG